MRLKIEKLVHGGQGIAHTEKGETAFVWNALPAEEVEADIIHKKAGIIEAIASTIYTPSPHRIEPLEDFYLSTAPWQIMTYDYENQMKQHIAAETYFHLGKTDYQLKHIYPEHTSGYRNKMEYSFYFDENDIWHIGFFNRGSHRKRATGVSVLAHPLINSVAEGIINCIREAHIPVKTLKSMIVRTNGIEVIAGIFVKDEYVLESLPTEKLSTLEHLVGLKIYYSRPQSPASTMDKLLFESGKCELTETFENIQLTYGLMSFFQIYPDIFVKAMKDIEKATPENSDLLDYFSGVGAIGLLLHKKSKKVVLVESNAEAIHYAQHNIATNNLANRYTAICAPAEKANDYITDQHTVIFDPPRAGLHSDTIKHVLEVVPPKIIYMSCNISTHARDLALLQQKYKITNLQIFNFFPRTPHIEGLAILEIS